MIKKIKWAPVALLIFSYSDGMLFMGIQSAIEQRETITAVNLTVGFTLLMIVSMKLLAELALPKESA